MPTLIRAVIKVDIFSLRYHRHPTYIIQLCSGIMRGRVLNGELYAQRFQKLIQRHLAVFVPTIKEKPS